MAQRPAIPITLPLDQPFRLVDWSALIPDMGRANRSLADYNGLLRHLPNASMLLAPLTMQEAVLSSRIEGTLATMSEVLQFEAGGLPLQEARRHDIEEILNYPRGTKSRYDAAKRTTIWIESTSRTS